MRRAQMDDADLTDQREFYAQQARLAEVRRKATMAPGEPGECQGCGEESPRLVQGNCARCRDKYKLP